MPHVSACFSYSSLKPFGNAAKVVNRFGLVVVGVGVLRTGDVVFNVRHRIRCAMSVFAVSTRPPNRFSWISGF